MKKIKEIDVVRLLYQHGLTFFQKGKNNEGYVYSVYLTDTNPRKQYDKIRDSFKNERRLSIHSYYGNTCKITNYNQKFLNSITA